MSVTVCVSGARCRRRNSITVGFVPLLFFVLVKAQSLLPRLYYGHAPDSRLDDPDDIMRLMNRLNVDDKVVEHASFDAAAATGITTADVNYVVIIIIVSVMIF
jgi:hypothetical protein